MRLCLPRILVLLFLSAVHCQEQVISVFGSSVANGVGCRGNCSGIESDSTTGGCYQSRLKQLQKTKGRRVFNNCQNGDTASALVARFDQVLSVRPRFILIALSLASEGLMTGDPQAAYNRLEQGLLTLTNMSRAQGISPVIGLCFPNNGQNSVTYAYVKTMNLLIQSWDVPSINFLGALDDGAGRWIQGYSLDASTPNDEGSTLMYHTIVPSVWDAIVASKPVPRLVNVSNLATLSSAGLGGLGDWRFGRLAFTPTDSAVYSWTLGVSIRLSSYSLPSGVFGSISSANKTSVLRLERGALRYESVSVNVSLADDIFHQIVVSHSFPRRGTQVYVDGVQVGRHSETVSATEFTIGGVTDSLLNVRDWTVHRSSLNDDEISAMWNNRILLPASLEVYAPLEAGPSIFINKAQSMATIVEKPNPPTVDSPTPSPWRAPSDAPTVEAEGGSSFSIQLGISLGTVGLLCVGLVGWKIYKRHSKKQVAPACDAPPATENSTE